MWGSLCIYQRGKEAEQGTKMLALSRDTLPYQFGTEIQKFVPPATFVNSHFVSFVTL